MIQSSDPHPRRCQCSECGRTEGWMYLHARCHPDVPPSLRVLGDLLEVRCLVCDRLVTRIRIAADQTGVPTDDPPAPPPQAPAAPERGD